MTDNFTLPPLIDTMAHIDEVTEKPTRAASRPKSPMIRVSVNQTIIDDSKERDSSHCMIAEAIKMAVPNAKAVSVDLQTIRFSDKEKGLRYIYLTPRSAQVALVQFDQGIDVEPFSLKLRGGHVIKAGKPIAKHTGSPEVKAAAEKGKAASANVIKQSMRLRDNKVPERVGGQAPPKMRNAENIPMSRRREFGLRALVR